MRDFLGYSWIYAVIFIVVGPASDLAVIRGGIDYAERVSIE